YTTLFRSQGCLVGMCLLQDKRVLSLPGSPVRHQRILEDVGTQPLRLGGMERWAGMASAGSQVVAREPLDAAQQRQGHSAPRTPVAAWRGDHLILWQTAIEHGQAMGPIAQVYNALLRLGIQWRLGPTRPPGAGMSRARLSAA